MGGLKVNDDVDLPIEHELALMFLRERFCLRNIFWLDVPLKKKDLPRRAELAG